MRRVPTVTATFFPQCKTRSYFAYFYTFDEISLASILRIVSPWTLACALSRCQNRTEKGGSFFLSISATLWRPFKSKSTSFPPNFELFWQKMPEFFVPFWHMALPKTTTFLTHDMIFPNEHREPEMRCRTSDQTLQLLLERPDSNRNITPTPITQTGREEVWVKGSNPG